MAETICLGATPTIHVNNINNMHTRPGRRVSPIELSKDNDNGNVLVVNAEERVMSPKNSLHLQNATLNRQNRRVVRLLLVVIVEFFVFWTPLLIISTWISIDSTSAKKNISYGIQFVIVYFAFILHVLIC